MSTLVAARENIVPSQSYVSSATELNLNKTSTCGSRYGIAKPFIKSYQTDESSYSKYYQSGEFREESKEFLTKSRNSSHAFKTSPVNEELMDASSKTNVSLYSSFSLS